MNYMCIMVLYKNIFGFVKLFILVFYNCLFNNFVLIKFFKDSCVLYWYWGDNLK